MLRLLTITLLCIFTSISARSNELPVDIDIAFQDCAALWVLTVGVAEQAENDSAAKTARSNAQSVISIYEDLIDGDSKEILQPVFNRFSGHMLAEPYSYAKVRERYTPACDAVADFLDLLRDTSAGLKVKN